MVRLGFLVAALAFRMGSRRPWGGHLKADGDPGEAYPKGKLAGDLGGLGAVVALRRRRSWQVGPAGQRKQRRGRGRVRLQAERG